MYTKNYRSELLSLRERLTDCETHLCERDREAQDLRSRLLSVQTQLDRTRELVRPNCTQDDTKFWDEHRFRNYNNASNCLASEVESSDKCSLMASTSHDNIKGM